MRILVMFDLPVTTKEERAEANSFRRWLLNDGYYMVQFSIYGRLCNGMDNIDAHMARLKSVAPSTGSIRVLTVTEKQYSGITIIAGKKKKTEKLPQFYQNTFFDEDFFEK